MNRRAGREAMGWARFGTLGLALLLCVKVAGAEPPRAPLIGLAFAPDNSSLVLTGNRSLEVVSSTNAARLRSMPCALDKVMTVAFHPGGKRFGVGGGTPGARGEFQWRRWPDGEVLARQTNFTDVITAAAVSPNGEWMAWVGADHTVSLAACLTDSMELGEPHRLAGHSGPVLGVAFSADNRWMATTGGDRSVRVWDVGQRKLVRSFSHHTAIVHGVAFRPQSEELANRPAYCATASDDKTVRVWQPTIGRMVRIVRGHEGPVFSVAFSRDGMKLISAGKEGVVRVIDSDSDEILRSWPAHDDWIYALAVSPDGTRLATGDWAGCVKLWDLETGELRGRSH